jgi:uncharacterized protein (TIGR02145 family)
MKNSILLSALILVLLSTINAQNDTMYIMKAGIVVGQYNVNTEVDSIVFYRPVADPTSGTFTDDRDGNVYNWIKIGNQVWMSENLKYLPDLTIPTIGSLTDPHFYVYDYSGNDVNAAQGTANYITYGVLYNWAAAMNEAESSTNNPSEVQGVCPTGWHLPSDAEWTELTDYLGGANVAGGKLKETGTTHWNSPNNGATNEVGFTALPGGYRFIDGYFKFMGNEGYWWSTTQSNSTAAHTRLIQFDNGAAWNIAFGKDIGFSVRCVRD